MVLVGVTLCFGCKNNRRAMDRVPGKSINLRPVHFLVRVIYCLVCCCRTGCLQMFNIHFINGCFVLFFWWTLWRPSCLFYEDILLFPREKRQFFLLYQSDFHPMQPSSSRLFGQFVPFGLFDFNGLQTAGPWQWFPFFRVVQCWVYTREVRIGMTHVLWE